VLREATGQYACNPDLTNSNKPRCRAKRQNQQNMKNIYSSIKMKTKQLCFELVVLQLKKATEMWLELLTGNGFPSNSDLSLSLLSVFS